MISPPHLKIDEHNSFEDESLDAHQMDSKDHSMELEDSIFYEEAGEEYGLEAQTNHTFSDKTNFQICALSPIDTRASPTASRRLITMLITEEFIYHFVEFKNYFLEAAFFLEHELGFEIWSRAYFPDNRKFYLVKIPYDHAMAALRLKYGDDYGLRVYDYSSPVYKVEEYLLAYSESINVVPLEYEWRVPQELLDVNIIPPLMVTKLGRKKRKCIKGVGETFKS
ncbi:hypothetical protein BC332_19389 [Capsicum chinense]|nr:hypothetical protein BC332_19389 [Capsicum chinense]